eukprot:Skav205682  [mRNA]  locus=scaffold2818:153016:156207:+ [translate_table: standard]
MHSPTPQLPIDYIRSQDWGLKLLALGTNWRAMAADRELCELLAKSCALCGEWFGRMQELTLHYQRHHPEVLPWVTPMSPQITRLMQQPEDASHVCAFCHATYRYQHTCPVTTQIAAVHYQVSSTQDLLPCLLCDLVPENLTELQLHLMNTHDLKTIQWDPIRDALRGEPCCRHCHQTYSVMNGLKQHIQQGRCPAFDIEAAPLEPSIDDQLQDAFWTGHLSQVLAEPHVRLKLAHTCQLCERTYDRSADLMVHLQQQHASLYHRGLNLQRYLIQQLYQDMGCLCAPTVTQETVTHVCPLFAQVAILHAKHRMVLYAQPSDQLPPHAGVLVPGHFTEEQVRDLLHGTTPEPVSDRLTTMLCGHLWKDLWQTLPVNLHLRCTCLTCGIGPLSPGALHNHILEDHAQGLPGAKHMLSQLLEPMWHTASNVHTCDCCKLTYGLPDSLQIVSKCLAQEHWSHQCPVALQVACLLSKNHNGQGLRDASRGDGRTDAGSLPSSGTLSQTRTRRASRRQTSSGGQPEQGHRKHQRKTTGPAPLPDQQGRAGSRTELEPAAPAGQLHPLPQPRGQRRIEDFGGRRSSMEEGHLTTADSSQPPVPHIAGGAEGPGHQAAPNGPAILVEDDGNEGPVAERRQLPLPEVEPVESPDASGPQNAGLADENLGIHAHRHAGPSLSGRPDSPIPCPGPSDPGVSTEASGDPLEVAAAAAGQLAPWTPPSTEPLCGVDLGGAAVEASQPDTEWAGEAATADDYGEPSSDEQGPGQGERESMTSALLDAVARVGLRPDRRHPYANDAFRALSWAHLCSDLPLQTFWGRSKGDVTTWLLGALEQETHFDLLQQPWSEGLVPSWGQETRPTNVAEFTQSLWFWMHPSNQMAWERRVPGKEVPDDCSIGQIPVELHPANPVHGSYLLQTLIESWSQTNSMCTAFLHDDPVICCYLDRREDLWKTRPRADGQLTLETAVQLPYFTLDGMVNYKDYVPMACVLHAPAPTSGTGFMSVLRICIDGTPQWLVCEGTEPTMQIERLTSEMERQITLVWMCKQSTYTMPELQSRASVTTDALVEMISRT